MPTSSSGLVDQDDAAAAARALKVHTARLCRQEWRCVRGRRARLVQLASVPATHGSAATGIQSHPGGAHKGTRVSKISYLCTAITSCCSTLEEWCLVADGAMGCARQSDA